jgi:hypothetical protein
MSFQAKDEALQRRIIESLSVRQTINMNAEVGKAYLQPEWEDKINPTVTVTRDEIKKLTGREKLRDVVLDEYAKALAKPGVDVQRVDDDTLRVSLAPMRVKSNEFPSLEDLNDKNKAALKDNPELGDPPY